MHFNKSESENLFTDTFHFLKVIILVCQQTGQGNKSSVIFVISRKALNYNVRFDSELELSFLEGSLIPSIDS